MATELTTEQQYELVYQGIKEVAVRCDGARSLDYVGFDGTDTHYGRRVASVPFSDWTDDVKVECAKIANKYQKQILAYTGIDVSTLQVVRDALSNGTNYAARDQARRYEKLAEALKDRKIDVVDGKLGIFYGRKDPDFDVLLNACKALPGRSFDWDRKCNVVEPSEAVEAFIQQWDFPLTPAAEALLTAPRAIHYEVTLATLDASKVVIDTPYNPNLVEAIRSLPGRSWNAASKINTADTHPRVLALVAQFNLSISPDAKAACEGAQAALESNNAANLAAGDRATVAAHVSRLKSPEELPAVFVQMLQEVLGDV